ncbi:MAG TPA: 1-(5-phosphoribosyl)-5-[(5-phosphoribosylamino)methylideneamino] imidazole-4-carboxamide isomerase [Candidatus Limnocylindrales bacterium]|nr:1-(5-phosphoribosyl)-5-[(5-phosphoribosylamino)methylideneamino] imidazole-4-carboxamide isomerase [Candidatus Limnocylindrales bacterium]
MSIGPGSSVFELLPAIDLRAGQVVRLRAGDFANETVFSDDPVETARGFVASGARWIHIVDLDGARGGGQAQGDVIRAVLAAIGELAACEVAGGLRDRAAVASTLAGGASRVVVGTAALSQAGFAADLIRTFGSSRIVVALDVRAGEAVGDGWRDGAPGVPVGSALRRLAAEGVTTFEVTTIERDGGLGGPDLELLTRVVGLGLGRIIASGGIRSVDDLLAVRSLGCIGAIVGRAVYDGSLDLAASMARLAVPPR